MPYSTTPSVEIIAIVVPSVAREYRYSVPLDVKDTVSDLLEKFHRISRLDDENYFGLYPEEVLGLLREDYLRYHDLTEQRLRETERAWKYAGKTLVLLYINK
jgi:hypothetical protein